MISPVKTLTCLAVLQAISLGQAKPLTYSVTAKARPLGEVLEEVATKAGLEISVLEEVDLKRRVDIDVSDAPLGTIVESLGLTLMDLEQRDAADSEFRSLIETKIASFQTIHAGKKTPGHRTIQLPGLQLATTLRNHAGGLLVETWPTVLGRWLYATLEVDSVKIGGKSVSFESCAEHSPWRVFIADPPDGNVVLQYSGHVHRLESVKANFGAGDDARKRHDFGHGASASFSWPKLRVRYRHAVPERLAENNTFTFVKIMKQDGSDPIIGGGMAAEFQMNPLEPESKWCSCDSPKPDKGPETTRIVTFDITEKTKLESKPKNLRIETHLVVIRSDKFKVTSAPVSRHTESDD